MRKSSAGVAASTAVGNGMAAHAAAVVVRAARAAHIRVPSCCSRDCSRLSAKHTLPACTAATRHERQLLTVRPGFEPQACQVPAQRGIYLFSLIFDIMQVRCAAFTRPLPRLCLLPCLSRVALHRSWRPALLHSPLLIDVLRVRHLRTDSESWGRAGKRRKMSTCFWRGRHLPRS